MYKYPLMVCSVGCLYYKRKLVQAHSGLFKKSFYLRLDSPAKMTHNGLQFGLMILYVVNFASFLVGLFFSATQYSYGLKSRYIKPMDFEVDLRSKYLNEMQAYNRLIHCN